MKRSIMTIFTGMLFLALFGCGKTPQTAMAAPAPTALPADTVTPRVEEKLLTPTPTEPPTPSPTATPEPTPEPTPTPEPLTFTASEHMPLPDEDSQLQRGLYFWLDGVVTGPGPLGSVRAQIIDDRGQTVQEGVKTFAPSEETREYRLLDLTFSKDIQCVSEALKFQDLPAGSYTLRILAAEKEGEERLLAESAFRVTDQTWLQLQPNNLRGNYTTALAFFGSPERFMFRYKLKSGSNRVEVDAKWRSRYKAKARGLNGKKWTCHVDAVPYLEQACRYMEQTYIHISGKGFDTGRVRLSSLVAKMNGIMVHRFVGDRTFISHHSFGTAIDINASYACNKGNPENREKIFTEVTQNLTYNGIVTIQGKQCYDFTYTGTVRGGGVRNIPEPLTNYFLYELAFFRAGFSWGVYYPHKSDAMHFTLSELSPELFTDGPYAMRKVFSYIEDQAEAPDPA